MQPIAPGDPVEPRPVPAERTPSQGPPPRGRAPMPAPGARNADRFGSVAVRVQPADAEVFIDGERWDTPAGEDRLLVELSEGTHRVEIRKAGHKPYIVHRHDSQRRDCHAECEPAFRRVNSTRDSGLGTRASGSRESGPNP